MLTFSVLALLMFASFASADVNFLDSDDLIITTIAEDVEQGSSITISFKADELNDGDLTAITFNTPLTMTLGSTSTTFDSNSLSGSIVSLDKDTTSTLMTLTFNIPEFQEVGAYNGDLVLTGEYTASPIDYTLPIALTVTEKPRPKEVTECALIGNNVNKDLEIKIEDIKIEGFGGEDDDYEWFAFDDVEIELEIENDNNDDKMKDVTVGWGLYDTDAGEWYIDEEENDFNLREEDKKNLFITFSLDDDIDELPDGDYVFYVWANAELDDGSETKLCASVSEEVEIIDESDFVILNNIQMIETATCGSQVQVTADVWNIGSDNQEEVYVVIQSEEGLGITQKIDIGDVDAYEDEEINILLNIPVDAEEKSYMFYLSVFDEYGDMFENDNDDRAKFPIQLNVEGNCINEPKVTISADLESDAVAGKELIVRVTILNTGTQTSTLEISLSDYSEWASLESIVPETVTLNAGESEDIVVTLNVNSGVSGNQNFEIIATEGTNVLAKSTQVTIEESSGRGLSAITGGLISEGNWPIWTIGAVNIILVFIIIIVALKVSRK